MCLLTKKKKKWYAFYTSRNTNFNPNLSAVDVVLLGDLDIFAELHLNELFHISSNTTMQIMLKAISLLFTSIYQVKFRHFFLNYEEIKVPRKSEISVLLLGFQALDIYATQIPLVILVPSLDDISLFSISNL